MKKILLFICIILICNNIQSQTKDRLLWFDYQLAQNFGLNNWSDYEFINNELYKPMSSELKFTINLNFYKSMGLYMDLGLALHSYPKNNGFEISHYPIVNFDNYFMEDPRSHNEQPALGGTGSLGLFYKISLKNNWRMMPSLGIGVQDINAPKYHYTLKEKGANSVYFLDYNWFSSEKTDSHTLGYLTAKLNFSHRISSKISLLFGIEYRYFFNRVEFSAKTTDYYNNTIINEAKINGNHMNTLGFSIGISSI